jgi:hypothetical protein
MHSPQLHDRDPLEQDMRRRLFWTWVMRFIRSGPMGWVRASTTDWHQSVLH